MKSVPVFQTVYGDWANQTKWTTSQAER